MIIEFLKQATIFDYFMVGYTGVVSMIFYSFLTTEDELAKAIKLKDAILESNNKLVRENYELKTELNSWIPVVTSNQPENVVCVDFKSKVKKSA
jgi:hypothetical protein